MGRIHITYDAAINNRNNICIIRSFINIYFTVVKCSTELVFSVDFGGVEVFCSIGIMIFFIHFIYLAW